MAINIRQLNDGQPKSNPYGKVTQIKPSFAGVDYYDCYIPYGITNEQLGGYSLQTIIDGREFSPMPDAIKRMRVANRINTEGDYISPYLSNYSVGVDSSTTCRYMTNTDKNGIETYFYMSAVQPFFLRSRVGRGTPPSSYNDGGGYFPYSTANRGQLIDVILTDGTCIHIILNDINSVDHTNCGNNEPGTAKFAPTTYNQYHNVISAIGGNTFEISHPGNSQAAKEAAVRGFANKFSLGTYGTNGVNDVAFYRVYNAKIDNFTLTDSSYAALSYKISDDPGPDPPDPPTPDPDPDPEYSEYVIEEKGIFGLQVNFPRWATGTGLRRIGDGYIKLKATKTNNIVSWSDITDSNNIKKLTPTQLSELYGITYTKVNDGYVGKFYVTQKPLDPKFGGTGARSLEELFAAIHGISGGDFDFDGWEPGTMGDGKIELPNISPGHFITSEARSEERGSIKRGDQGQPSTGIDTVGEVSLVYDRDINVFTNLYRLYSDDSKKNATYKKYALQAANHACFLAQNSNIGYNFGTDQEGLITYIRENKGNIQFHKFNSLSDTNCMNLCKLAYMAVFPENALYRFNTNWYTAGILEGHTLENLGFRKFDTAYTRNVNNLEIGDILIKKGHAAIVVGVANKSWVLNGIDYNPAKGEVKT